jgi:hypothetical protein
MSEVNRQQLVDGLRQAADLIAARPDLTLPRWQVKLTLCLSDPATEADVAAWADALGGVPVTMGGTQDNIPCADGALADLAVHVQSPAVDTCPACGDPAPGAPRERWVIIDTVGGWVCAEPDPDQPDGECGMPVESEPCDRHRDGAR